MRFAKVHPVDPDRYFRDYTDDATEVMNYLGEY